MYECLIVVLMLSILAVLKYIFMFVVPSGIIQEHGRR